MKPIRNLSLHSLAGCLAAVLLAGCTTQQQQQAPPPAAPTQHAEAAPVKKSASGDYGPHYTTFEANGQKYVKGSLGFPSGLREGSGLLLEKTTPTEVNAGTPFTYNYKVINQAPCEVRDVVVSDRVSSNFKASSASPQPANVADGVATWRFSELAPGQAVDISVTGTSTSEGNINTCGWATYTPVICDGIKVVKPALQLTKTLPAEVSMCDPIPATFVVKNSGSSTLTDVKVTDPLPAGLKTADGQSSLVFNVGTLAPGASKELKATLGAAQTGKYDNTAKATCAQNVEAEAKASVVVRAPVLALSCDAPAERFAGRPAEFCYTVSNKGDGVAANTVVEAPVPTGAVFQSATGGGVVNAGRVVWNVGNVAPGASSKLCATFVLAQPGNIQLSASAKGTCAKEVTSSCGTRVLGIPAVLLEVVDVEDPIEVGKDETYIIEVTNQGTAPATNLRLTCKLEESQEYVSGSGATTVTAAGRTITTAPLPSLAPKQKATWKIVVKALKAGDIRFDTQLLSDQLTRPVSETESTNQY